LEAAPYLVGKTREKDRGEPAVHGVISECWKFGEAGVVAAAGCLFGAGALWWACLGQKSIAVEPLLEDRGEIVETVFLSRQQNAVFIFTATTPEKTCSVPDQWMWPSRGIKWRWVQCTRRQQLINCCKFGII